MVLSSIWIMKAKIQLVCGVFGSSHLIRSRSQLTARVGLPGRAVPQRSAAPDYDERGTVTSESPFALTFFFLGIKTVTFLSGQEFFIFYLTRVPTREGDRSASNRTATVVPLHGIWLLIMWEFTGNKYYSDQQAQCNHQ